MLPIAQNINYIKSSSEFKILLGGYHPSLCFTTSKKKIDIHKAIGNMKHLNWRADFWGEKRVKTQPVKDTNNNLRLTSAGEMLRYLRANSVCTEFRKGYWLNIALKLKQDCNVNCL